MNTGRRLLATIFIASYAGSTGATATFNEVKSSFKPSDTLILDRHGELLHRLRTDASVRRGQWVALADVSPALRTALVLSEDKRPRGQSYHRAQAIPDWCLQQYSELTRCLPQHLLQTRRQLGPSPPSERDRKGRLTRALGLSRQVRRNRHQSRTQVESRPT